MPKKAAKNSTTTDRQSLTLTHPPLPAGVTRDAFRATRAVEGLAHNAVTTVQFSESPMGELALAECLNALNASVARVDDGSLQQAESLLLGQAVALNAIFTNLALRAKVNMGAYPDATDRYLRLALKAQGQCRATLETLADIKNPPTVFARQANIANGPQQVNNNVTLARADNHKNLPSELLEAHGERLDVGTASTTGTGDQVLAPVGTRHRAENG